MSSASEASGCVLRNGRVIPSRTVNRSVTPIDGLHSGEGLEADRNSGEGKRVSSRPFVDEEKTCNVRKPTRTLKGARSIVPEERSSYAGSCVSSRFKTVSYIRKEKLAAELRAEVAIMELEKKLILKRLEVEKAELDGLADGDLTDDQATSEPAVQYGREKTQEWIAQHKPQDEPWKLPSAAQRNKANTLSPHLLDDCRGERTEMRMMLARQSNAKELPIFSGDSQEWPAFISQFRRSTTVCGYNADENLMRLQRCLKGRARETVAAMLSLPENVPVVVAALERRFGRPYQIIGNMIGKIMQMSAIQEDKPDSIIDLSNAVIGLVASMKSLGHCGHMMNPQLLQELVGKLTPTLRLQWGAVAVNGAVDVESFSDWLLTIADAASYISVPTAAKRDERKQAERKPSHHVKEVVLTAVDTRDSKCRKCAICGKKSHCETECEDFRRSTVSNRWKLVKQNRLCYRCLKKGHGATDCKSTINCLVEGCDRTHHPMLHEERGTSNPRREVGGAVFSHSSCSPSQVLLRILPVTLYGPLSEFHTYALLDEASTVTLLTQSVADAIGTTGQQDPLRLQWTNNMSQSNDNPQRVKLGISGADGKRYELQNVRTVDDLALPIQSVDGNKLRRRWTHLADYEVPSLRSAQPTILLGQDNCHLIVARTVVEGAPNAPVLSETKLGWILHGNVPFTKRVDAEFSFFTCCDASDAALHELVKQSFTAENFGVRVPEKLLLGRNEERAMHILQDTTRRTGERYEAGLLWRTDEPSFPPSKAMALKRLKSMEKKMDMDEDFAVQYCQKIEEYVQKGYAVQLTDSEVQSRPTKWFLPHFAVKNDNKPGKIRFVFDAAAKSNGISLNDMLLPGPDMLVPLTNVLFKFRTNEIAIGGDIKEMFHQVNIRVEDRAAQRFLWRGRNRTDEPSVYEMKAMTFGATFSPTTAQYVKNINAARFKDVEPDAYYAVLHCHYVDDYLDSVSTEEEAVKRAHAVIRVHDDEGFQIRNWASSSARVLQQIPNHLRAVTDEQLIGEEKLPCERILGIRWDPNCDQFMFVAKLKTEGGKLPQTKREILRVVMSLFDPLGFLANYIVRAKILLQDIWRSAIGWDDEVAGTLLLKWKDWLSLLPSVRNLAVQRPYSYLMRKRESVELHVMYDASEQAFASVAYLRVVGSDFTSIAWRL